MPDPPLPQDVYAKCLPGSRGHPLWLPEPSNTLPSEYQRDGLQIGDVGIVDSSGGFDVFFNICRPRRHKLHARLNIPAHCEFEPVPLDIDREIDVRFEAGPCVISSGVTRRPDSYEFVPSSTQGAILVLADGATRYDLQPQAKQRFREVAEDHAIHWCTIAEGRYGRKFGSLYLITGSYKSCSWSLASFDDPAATQPNSRILLVQPDDNPARGRLEGTFHIDGRAGPWNNQNGGVNQTVFISGFKIAMRDDVLGWLTQQPVVESFPAASDEPRLSSVGALKLLFTGDKRPSKYRRRTIGDEDADHVPK